MRSRIRTPRFRLFFAEFRDLVRCECGPLAEVHAPILGPLDPVLLALDADFEFELVDGAQHVDQKPPCGVGGVGVLVQHDQVDAPFSRKDSAIWHRCNVERASGIGPEMMNELMLLHGAELEQTAILQGF